MPLPRPDRRATLDHLFGSDVPVIRQPFAPGDPLPYWGARPATETILFDRDADPLETANIVGDPREKQAVDLLRAALEDVDAPKEQYERLGIG